MEQAYKLTTTGSSIIAACVANQVPLVITRVAFGDGRVSESTDLSEVHKLVHYISDGTVGAYTRSENQIRFTVQYDNKSHPAISTFQMAEFIVYAEAPDTGEEKDLLYATLGDYTQSVPAYSPYSPPSVWDFPLTLVIASDIEVSVTAPSGLVTYADLQSEVNKACKELIYRMANISFVVPAAAWIEDPAKANGYGYYYDLADEQITQSMVPNVTVAEADLETVKRAGMCQTATSYVGYVRLKCVEHPEADIAASCTLLINTAIDSEISGGAYTLPVATVHTLGGIKASDTVTVDNDGTAHAVAEIDPSQYATDEEVAAALDDIFGVSP